MNLDELESLLRESKPGVVPVLSGRILAMIAVIRAADAMRKTSNYREDDYDAARAKLEEL